MLGVGLEFVLFAILGWCVFSPPQGNARMVVMIVFIVLMILWLVGIFTTGNAMGWHLFGTK